LTHVSNAAPESYIAIWTDSEKPSAREICQSLHGNMRAEGCSVQIAGIVLQQHMYAWLSKERMQPYTLAVRDDGHIREAVANVGSTPQVRLLLHRERAVGICHSQLRYPADRLGNKAAIFEENWRYGSAEWGNHTSQ
jgi:hypothetical protein